MFSIIPVRAEDAAKYPFRCAPYPEVMRAIQGYHEELVGTGFTERNRIVQQFRSEAGSFTIVEVYPDLRTCITQTGDKWRARFPFSDAA